MARPASPQLTEAEQRIMEVLWTRGEASVREITDALHAEFGLAYTTVLTTIGIMADKGHVDFRKAGRAHIYSPVLTRDGARNQALGSMVRTLFGGSAQSLAQHLVRAEKLSLQDIEDLRAAVLEQSGPDGAGEKNPDGEAR
ncbi:BlaI/MecI/CopY family transcriptional regulator [Maricaulis sp.]|uniref:BlaI/MecI/CopY family transcriptional regulator n=1 Tax=Maricaulis sp. TaxID=1486257 RepID=UPI002B271791|nr:BlaI/MecI/CopY family transcriptional regulator [Maricaulis sp.]